MPEVYVDPATDESELAAAARLRVALDRRRGLRSRDGVESLALLSPGASNAQPPPDFVPETGRKAARIEHRLSWRLSLLKAISWVALVALGIFGPLVQLSHLTEFQIASTLVLIVILVPASYPATPRRRGWSLGGPSREDRMNPAHQVSATARLTDTAPALTQVWAVFSPPFAVGWWLGLVPFFLAWYFWLRNSSGGFFGAIVSAVVSVLLLTAGGLAAAWSSGSLHEYRAWKTQLAPILGFAIGANLIPDVVLQDDTVVERIAFVVAVFGTPFAHVVSAAITLTAWNQWENRGIEHRFLLALVRHVAWVLLLAAWYVATLVGHGYWQIAAGAVLIVMLYLLHRSWSRERTGTMPDRSAGPPVPLAVPPAAPGAERTHDVDPASPTNEGDSASTITVAGAEPMDEVDPAPPSIDDHSTGTPITVALERPQAEELVRRLMERELHRRGTRSLNHPVLVIEAARGYGKTALIEALARRLNQRVPYALIDFERHRGATVPEVLSAIAFQLSETRKVYGSLQFPLLGIGRLVMVADLPDSSRQEARAAVERFLEVEVGRDTMRSILWDTAGSLTPTLSTDDRGSAAGRFVAAALDGLRRIGRAKPLSPAWYGHRDRGHRNHPLDVLVDLNRWTKEEMIPEINELLWDAFLTDLRENFQESRHAADMTLNCVLLLDNVDTPLGQEFVNGLVTARKSRLAREQDPADPMTVVATSRGELLAGVPQRELVEYSGLESDHQLTPERWEGSSWWCRYTLHDLSEDETDRMVYESSHFRRGGQLIGYHQLTSMVYGFTGGHPASTAMLVDAMHEHPLKNGDTLAVLLDRRVPGLDPESPLLRDSLVQRMLGVFTADTYEDLVTCAMARTSRDARLLAASGELLVGGINSYREIAPVLWPASGGAGSVILRRLLLRQLAARADDEAASWTKVVDWFRARCVQDGDKDGVLHYAIAGGDITATSDGLRQRLASDDPADWVRLLGSVTSMPRRPTDPAVSPMDQLRATINERSSRLTRLIVAQWIAFDPFISNQRSALHLQIAADYDFIAGLTQGDPEALLNEADDHRNQAELWGLAA